MTEIIKDPDVPRETRLPSVAGREEPPLNQDEEDWVNQLWKYVHGDSSRMTFDAIFSLTTLAAYLRYPQIEGLSNELLLEGSRVQLTRKRNGTDSTTSGLLLPEGKKSKVSSKVLLSTASEPSRLSHLQLSLPKEMAVPRKSRYDKGKSKVNHNLLEDPPVVNSRGSPLAKDGKEKTTILNFLSSTRPSREVTVPIKKCNPLIIPSMEITLSIEENNPSGIPPPGVLHPLVSSSATNPTDLLTTEKTQEIHQAEAEVMEPSSSKKIGRGGTSSLLPEFMDDEVTGLQRENLTVDQIFAENLDPTRPSNSQISKGSVKLVGETANWAGDPLKAFEDWRNSHG
jgi:hypothetical protein